MFRRIIPSLLLLLCVSNLYPAAKDTSVRTEQSYDRLIANKILIALYENKLEELTKLLTANKKYIDFQYAPDNATLLIKATEKKNINAVRRLVNLGANVDICNKQGQSAITLAQKNKYKDIEEILTIKKIIESKNHGEKRRNTDASEERSQKKENEKEKKRKVESKESAEELESIPLTRPVQSGETTSINPSLVYSTLTGMLPTTTPLPELPLPDESSKKEKVEKEKKPKIKSEENAKKSESSSLKSSSSKTSQKTKKTSSEKFICTVKGCKRDFKMRSGLTRHLSTYHKIPKKRNAQGETLNQCYYCGLELSHVSAHEKNHKPIEDGWICTEGACGSNPPKSHSYFKSKTGLTNHKLVHKKEKSEKEPVSDHQQDESKEIKEEAEQKQISEPARSLELPVGKSELPGSKSSITIDFNAQLPESTLDGLPRLQDDVDLSKLPTSIEIPFSQLPESYSRFPVPARLPDLPTDKAKFPITVEVTSQLPGSFPESLPELPVDLPELPDLSELELPESIESSLGLPSLPDLPVSELLAEQSFPDFSGSTFLDIPNISYLPPVNESEI